VKIQKYACVRLVVIRNLIHGEEEIAELRIIQLYSYSYFLIEKLQSNFAPKINLK